MNAPDNTHALARPDDPAVMPHDDPLGIHHGDPLVVHPDALVIAGRAYRSRLLVGTGKYKDFDETRAAIDASGAEIVTVAIRRTNIGQNANEPSLLDYLPPSQFTLLPNTAGCYSADDAVRTLKLARELLDGHRLVQVDAGVGTSSDAAVAMELGCAGVLMNTAIASAQRPVLMAGAMKKAIEAGREAYLAGRMPRKSYAASPSSPTGGLIS